MERTCPVSKAEAFSEGAKTERSGEAAANKAAANQEN